MSGVFLSVLVSALSKSTVCFEINIDLISVFAISKFFSQYTHSLVPADFSGAVFTCAFFQKKIFLL